MVKEPTTPEVRAWLERWYETGEGDPISFVVDVVPAAQISAGWLIPGTELWGSG